MSLSRRLFLVRLLQAAGLSAAAWLLGRRWLQLHWHEEVCILRANSYEQDLARQILQGMHALGIGPREVAGKRILLKPNLVEPTTSSPHINTHPAVVYGAAAAFRSLGASHLIVAEGPGHNHDSLLVLEESGLAEVLISAKLPFVDLNHDQVVLRKNAGGHAPLKTLALPATLGQVDWIVSLPKLKTHHWTGVTLSLKNLFGVMPGNYYGWPKNVLHWAGISRCILDIAATVRPHFAIVDGIVGMEGDGPIMGTPKQAGVLVMGRNLTAVDATCSRIMGINPYKVEYLAKADGWLGPLSVRDIRQRGESPEAVQNNFLLLKKIPAHRNLRG